MTVQSETTPQIVYDGNSITTNFPITFPYNEDESTIYVVHVNSSGVETTWTLNGLGSTGYTVVSDEVVANTAPDTNEQLVIYRSTPITQLIDLITNQAYSANILESALDLLTLMVQEIDRNNDYSIRAPLIDSSGLLDLPNAASRVGKYLTFDANGDPLVSSVVTAANATMNVYFGSSYADFNAALAAIGATPATLIMDSALAVTANVEIPSTLHVDWWRAGAISGAYTVTYNGGMSGTLNEHFASNVTLAGTPKVEAWYPEWRGVVGDGATDDATNLNLFLTDLGALSVKGVLTSTTYRIDSTLTLPHNFSLEGATSYIFGSTIDYYGAGEAVTQTNNTNVHRLTMDGIHIRNLGTGTVGLRVIDAQDSTFDRMSFRDFTTAQVVLEAGTNGSFWNRFNNCRFYIPDVANSAGVYHYTGGAKACNANTYDKCNFHGINQDTTKGFGFLENHASDANVAQSCWFESLEHVGELGGVSWKFDNCRGENIYRIATVDGSEWFKFLNTTYPTAGQRVKVRNCSSDTGSISYIDEADAAFTPTKTQTPPFSDSTTVTSDYARANGDGKNGIIESDVPADILLAFQRSDLTDWSGLGIQFHFYIESCTVVGGSDGDNYISLRGLSDALASQVIGKEDDATQIYNWAMNLPVGTHSISFSSPPMLSGLMSAQSTFTKLGLFMSEPASGSVTLAGLVSISYTTFYIGEAGGR